MIQKQKPCFMHGTTNYLESILNKDMIVFEWGSGRSTQWFADRVRFIYSVEHQDEWFKITSNYLVGRNNWNLIFRPIDPIDDYVSVIDEIGRSYDLIIIDGRNRVACLERAMNYLKSNGYLVFDDIERIRYTPAKRILSKLPVKYFVGSLHKNCIFDDDPSGFTRQITGVYHYE